MSYDYLTLSSIFNEKEAYWNFTPYADIPGRIQKLFDQGNNVDLIPQ